MTISNTGNVGISTTSPSYKLQVGDLANTSGTLNDIFITGDKVNTDGYYSRLIFGNSSQSGGSTASIRGERKSSNYATELTFYTNPSSGAGDGSERMRITSGGNVLIGTTTNFSQEAASVLAISVKNSASLWGINMQADAAGAYRAITFYNSAGTSQGYISVNGSGTTTYATTASDSRLKQNIKDWNENVLDAFSNIKPKTF